MYATLIFIGLFSSSLTLLRAPQTADGHKSLFNFPILKNILTKQNRSLVIFTSRKTEDAYEDFFKEIHPNNSLLSFTHEAYPQLSLETHRKYGAFFLVILKREDVKEFFSLNLTSSDVFFFIECDQYDYTKRDKVCKTGIHMTEIAALYDPLQKTVRVCGYYCDKYQINCLREYSLQNPKEISMEQYENNYSSLGGYELKVGYVNNPPHIYK